MPKEKELDDLTLAQKKRDEERYAFDEGINIVQINEEKEQKDFLDTSFTNELQLSNMEHKIQVVSSTMQNQINQLRAKVAALERKVALLNETKRDL